jgi:sorbitol-specific phosphotransferase system component IIC
MIVVLGLLAWLLLSMPLAVVVGRGIAEADRRAAQASVVAPASRHSIAG